MDSISELCVKIRRKIKDKIPIGGLMSTGPFFIDGLPILPELTKRLKESYCHGGTKPGTVDTWLLRLQGKVERIASAEILSQIHIIHTGVGQD